MIARSSLSVIFLAFAVALLLLFVGSDTAHGVTWKVKYTTTLSDATAGANADVGSILTIDAPHSNFGKLVTGTAPPEWYIAPDSAIPDSAGCGTPGVVATSTLAVVGGCTTTVMVTIPLFDATTAETNTVDWVGDGSNITADPDLNGMPNGVDKYPSFLNQMFNGLKPRARCYGYTNAIAGAPPTQLNFVIFNPGQFVSATGWPGFPKPEQEMGDALGYMNYVVLDNPTPGNAAPSAIQEFCAPLQTVSTLAGKTTGQGEAIPIAKDLSGVVAAEVTGQCAGAQVGRDNDNDGVADDGCIVVTDVCYDSADSPAAVNDGCPATGPGLTPEAGVNCDGAEAGANCADAIDNDGDTTVNDGCPQVGATIESGPQCSNATEDDFDGAGAINDGCPAIARDDDNDGFPNDGCWVVPLGGSGEMAAACRNNTDDEPNNDGDGWTDEDCGVVMRTNPAANSGILGTGTHLFHAYGQSYRDYDNDGISNNEDGCPVNPDRLNIGLTGVSSSRELVSSGTSSLGNECDDLFDDDGDCGLGIGAVCALGSLCCNDGCPGATVPRRTVEMDSDGDAIGDVCDPTPNGTALLCPDGTARNADQDCDAYLNRQDNCNLTANGLALDNQLDNDLDRCGNNTSDDGADDALINDGCPVAGTCPESAAQCNNATDDDGDTKINDGCPMSGAISEVCVNSADFGPCNDGIGNACDNVAGLSPTVADGAFAKDLTISAACVGANDLDTGGGDGWCDATEDLLGSDKASNTSTPEHTAVDYKWGAVTTTVAVGGPCNVGTNTCVVTSSAGMVVGQTVLIGSGTGPPALEIRAITNIVGSTLTLTLPNLTATHVNPEQVRALGIPLDPVPGTCSDFQWYASGTDAIGNGPAVNNDGDANANAPAELDSPPFLLGDPDTINDCDIMTWDGADQDGVAASTFAIKNATDNCQTPVGTDAWNPEQLNSDAGADATGDACDADDDEDKLSDIVEWKQGSDSKNIYSPRPFDMTEDGTVNVLDVLTFTGALATTTKPPYLFPACCCKVQPFRYDIYQNTSSNTNDLRVWFSDPVQIVSVTDNDSPANTWSWKLGQLKKLGAKITSGGVVEPCVGGVCKKVTIEALSCKKRQLVCWQWTLNAAGQGGSWNSTDCATISLP